MGVHVFLLIILGVYNLVVFGFYGVDKYKAIHHLWRIPERVLLFLAVIGGGLGAFLGGQIWHHKTRKWYFWMAWGIGLVVDVELILLFLKF